MPINKEKYENPYEKKWREEREEIEAQVKKMSLKAIRKEATSLTHENNWSGLRGREMTRLRVLEAEILKRTKKKFFVERIVYP